MSKYCKKIDDTSKISTRSGTEIILPEGFTDLSMSIIRLCSFSQGEIQKIIYITHGPELREAKQTLTNFPSPKARMEFLTTFEYSEADPIISAVFNYARELFIEIYELRNVLAHENWMSSEDFRDAVLFSKLNEQAKLSMSSGKLWHQDQTKSEDVYNAIIRYIRNVKIVSVADLRNAFKDANLCAWILMQIGFVLGQADPVKKAEMRRAFLVFRGTSHLFNADIASFGKVEVKSSRGKTIRR